MKKYRKYSWVDPRIIVKRSKIHGKGMFTTKNIKEGEIVMIWGGIPVKKKEYNPNLWRERTVAPINEKIYLGLPITSERVLKDEWMNHSCNPSCWLVDEVTIVARRDIKRGQEITVDVVTWDDGGITGNESYSDDDRCHCGSTKCRKYLKADDYKLSSLQKMYKGHFSPFIQKRINYEKTI